MSPASATARRPLAVRLLVLLLTALLLVLLGLGAGLAPASAAAFHRHGEDLMRGGGAAMRDLAAQQTVAVETLLVDLIRRSAAARAAAVADLPLELLGDDLPAIRAAIAELDAARAEQQTQNAHRLARELIRRADLRIDQGLAELQARQSDALSAFGSSLRTTLLTVTALLFALLLLVLALGLHRHVLAPTQRLRAATQRIAQGDLAVALPTPSGDELGDLAADFAAMVAELQRARAEVERLTHGLEAEVVRKTQHLEQALAELRSSHEQLARAERFAALGTLAGGIAHEFHNVIGGIRGCAGELLQDTQDPASAETLQVIQRAADRATSIVQQLLRFARRSLDRRGPVDLPQLAEDALRLCEPAARRQGVQVVRALAPAVVQGDADALHQVLVNLLTNALQAMPQGGQLTVRTAATERGGQFEVADTGVGIAEACLPHLFEPFFTTKDRGDHTRRGTGLGLSVSYGIVQAHGGAIAVASQPGAGSTFRVDLPAVPPPQAAELAPGQPAGPA
jgi:two-component system NtrC family sensor kinase